MGQHDRSKHHNTPATNTVAKVTDPLEAAKQGAPPVASTAAAAGGVPPVKLSREEVIELAGKAAMQAEYVDGKSTGLGQAEFERVCREHGVEPPAQTRDDEPEGPPTVVPMPPLYRVLKDRTVQLRGTTVILRADKVLSHEFMSQHGESVREQGAELEAVPAQE